MMRPRAERGPRSVASRAALLVLWALVTALACSCAHRSGVTGSGTIELDEVDIASLVGGRVSSIRVNEGDTVKAGDTLAVLDRGEILAQFEESSSQAQRAVEQWQDLKAGPRAPEILGARADLEAANAQLKWAESDLERNQKLFAEQLASAAERDRAASARDAARARRDAAAEQLRLLQSGSRRDQVAAAERGAAAARAQLAGARSRVGELVLVAPISGVVLLRNFEPGEIAAAGAAVLTLGNPDRLWMRVYIDTPRLAQVKLGDRAEVKIVGSAKPFPARVVEIATQAEFTPRAALTEEEQASIVFGVKLAIDPAGGVLKAGLPGEAQILPTTSPGAK